MGKFHSKQGELEVCKVDVKLVLHKSWHVFEVETTSFHVKNPNFECVAFVIAIVSNI